MTKSEKLSRLLEVATAIAVIASLVYVGREIQQNTSAIQAASSQATYEMYQARLSLFIENAEAADLAIRVRDDVSAISAADSLRWDHLVNLQLNLYEMVHNSAENGTMAIDMAESWLASLASWTCTPLARLHWDEWRESYTPSFVQRVEAAITTGPDCD